MDPREFFKKLGIFVGGVVVGGILGVLFAPAPGKETREKIKETLNDIEDKAKEKLGKVKEMTQNVIEKGKNVFKNKEEI
ncbi:MAG TPA: YtxH domain-containing protein [Spirochaetota bacterium]|nr:YtxH domain-containing protein [Spirochaetota bacterium]HOM39253.1 YtxH domain-containing protein [Spirochaetota bacterium]HPQ49254.1 YtxH domain-containing protein [Spirochaetota bacterium]